MTNTRPSEQHRMKLTNVSNLRVLDFYQRAYRFTNSVTTGAKVDWDKYHSEITKVISLFVRSAHTDDDYRLLAHLCALHDKINVLSGYKMEKTFSYTAALGWLDKVKNKVAYDFDKYIEWGFSMLQRWAAMHNPGASIEARERIIWLRDRINLPAIIRANAPDRLDEFNRLVAAVVQHLKVIYVADDKYFKADLEASAEFEKFAAEVKTSQGFTNTQFEQMLKIANNVIHPELSLKLHIKIVAIVLKTETRDDDASRGLVQMLLRCSSSIHSYYDNFAESVLYLLKKALKVATSIPYDKRTLADNDAISQVLTQLQEIATLNPPNADLQRRVAVIINDFYDTYLKMLPEIPLTEWSAIRGAKIDDPIEAAKTLLAMYGWLNAIQNKRDHDYILMQQICGKVANLCSRYLNVGNEREWLKDGILCFDSIKTKVPADYRSGADLWLRYGELYDVEDKTKYYSMIIDCLQHIPEATRTTEDRAIIERYSKAIKEFQEKREQAEKKAKEEKSPTVPMETEAASEQRNNGKSEQYSQPIFNVSKTSFT